MVKIKKIKAQAALTSEKTMHAVLWTVLDDGQNTIFDHNIVGI